MLTAEREKEIRYRTSIVNAWMQDGWPSELLAEIDRLRANSNEILVIALGRLNEIEQLREKLKLANELLDEHRSFMGREALHKLSKIRGEK